MYDNYLELGGVELVNNARTEAYIRNFLPGLKILCNSDGLHNALGDAAYDRPSLDTAPWYRSAVADTADFYGLFTSAVEGDDDSTRSMTITELTHSGGVQSLARHGSKELRVKGTMVARTHAGMEAGWTWLRAVLDDSPCGGMSLYCEGRPLHFFKASPAAATVEAANALVLKHARVMYRVEPIDGPRVTAKLNSKHAVLWEVEFTLNAGVPWAFTLPDPTATTTGVNPVTANEVTCPTQTDSYDDLVVDPTAPAVTRPPRPPSIAPFTMPPTWNRYTMSVPAVLGERSGRVVPTLVITTGASAVRHVRVRFYRIGVTNTCDFEGEFFIMYAPPNSVMTIDGARQLIDVVVAGKTKPASNLVTGSSGRPVKWPSMACGTAYTIYVESEGALGATIRTDISIRE